MSALLDSQALTLRADGRTLLNALDWRLDLPPGRVAVVSNTTVAPLYLERVRQARASDTHALPGLPASDDAFDAIGLAGNACSQDVCVVSTTHSRERTGSFDTGVFQSFPVKTNAFNRQTTEFRRESTKRSCVLIDNGHRVSRLVEELCEERSDSSAPKDDDVHVLKIQVRRSIR